ncbi:related to folylpolyglutamate synthetase [Rhynchosporium secalis]|uniref:tetrahydrofolate synthase n=1 Tax=Rhynchosporium secalis TaxID=38038 RepID=A0A1E1M3T8_RHYSE|nr:related to folylpolyglutamate synthetase [Rhynchosporium secalis]
MQKGYNVGYILQSLASAKSYQHSISLLNSIRRANSNSWKSHLNDLTSHNGPNDTALQGLIGRSSVSGMKDWLQSLGYESSNLSVIHIAGTKGKGSTCAFTDCFLREHGRRTGFPGSVGLYTSPSLLSTRERIIIDSKAISKAAFTNYFFEVWDRLGYDLQLDVRPERLPRYRQFLMLLSFHIFVKEGVDIAIYESHVGAEYDATSVVSPAVTGITTLGMDHVRALGPSIENIAWHKAGIMKPEVPAFSTSQEHAAAEVLKLRAAERNAPLRFVDVDPDLPANSPTLIPDVQRKNASLARILSDSFLRLKAPKGQVLTSQDILHGLELYHLPGRFQTIVEGEHQWFLDIAHNEMSLLVATNWFASTVLEWNSTAIPAPTRVLIFTHTFARSSGRDERALLKSIAEPLQQRGIRFDQIIITTLKSDRAGVDCVYERPESLVTQDAQLKYANDWKSIDPGAKVSITLTVEDAMQLAKGSEKHGNGVQTFVTGDTSLIGIVISLLSENSPMDENTLVTLSEQAG